ncbi:conserved Plasmodium protein, unknown function [Plasmodium relictum]|uniref:Uncharacterized protein n=1 Tax=Plasmodium relictum TaxID=85471 RepID=A0A1J1HCG5_PLARL|nr:conserved Plasmodium protein, unknown function [Plasmodium relictum]CRH03664.1 conserved Plasmodium protein, unknown function [Plasmodium relictum]
MDIEYVEGGDIDDLIKKIDINYKECKKYDMYIEEENTEEEKESFNNFKIKENKYEVNSKMKNLKNKNVDKNEIKKGIDNIKNIIVQKESFNDRNKKYINFKKANNKNALTNLNVRKKRILESSDESDQDEFMPSVRKIVDYVKKKKKNQRKK